MSGLGGSRTRARDLPFVACARVLVCETDVLFGVVCPFAISEFSSCMLYLLTLASDFRRIL